MTVYVDDMRARYRRYIMCHMIADTDQELRAMADKLGLNQNWHQGDHFDITLKKRMLAIRYGAVGITWRQAGAMCARRRKTGELGDPETAVEWLKGQVK